MSRTFRRHGDRIRMELAPFEEHLLRTLRDGLRQTLASGDEADPVVGRLFPSAVAGDEEADRELRRLLHDDLLQSRLDGLDALVDLLDRGTRRGQRLRVDLTDDEPMLVLGVLNDLRLAIGARVGVEDLDREQVDEDDPVSTSLAVMDHFAWLQEQLIGILDPAALNFHQDPGLDP